MTPRGLVVVLALGALPARAQLPDFFPPPAPGSRRVLPAVRAARPPVIDGRLDDEVWRATAPSDAFVQAEPNQGAPSTHQSQVWLAFDDDALYVAAALEQPGGFAAFNQRDLRRDFPTHECDSFSIIFDTLGDGRNAFSFSVNPFGAQRDQQVVDDALFEANWDTVWRAQTRRDERGWTVEVAIPWKSVRHGGPGVTWGVQFFRRERGRNEDTVWSPIPRTVTAWRMPYAGVIAGLEPPKPSLLSLQLRPYLIGRLERVGEGPAQLLPSGGGEVTWNPGPNTVVDLTGNTDFAETDVDRRVVNLSRFSVFFPERRQFFLESAGVFSAGSPGFLQPFFSRQIGLDGSGQPVPVSAGGRFVYRSPERSGGALVVHALPNATSPQGALFGVARYAHNLGEQSRVGGMVVARHDFATAGAPGATNVVPVVDGLFRTGPITVTATAMGSTTDADVAGGASQTRLGGAGVVEAKLEGNWGELGVNALGITPDFEARTGFVARPDVFGVGANGSLDFGPAWLPEWLRAIGPWVDTYALWGASTAQFQEWFVALSPLWLLFKGGDEAWVAVDKATQVLTEEFSPVRGVSFPAGTYTFERFGLSAFTQASRKVAARLEVGGGGYYSASQVSVLGQLSVQPLPHVQVAGQYTWNRFWGPGVTGPFAQTHLLLVETRLALNPKLQLIGSYQRDTDGNRGVLNARLAWEFLPLSFVYVVVTDSRPVFAEGAAAPAELKVVAKVTYTWRP